jgi:AcrR family transcriptional regulator
VASVIQRAGVSRKTFYEHFADKEDCFIAAYDGVVERLLIGVTSAFESESRWPDQVRAGLSAVLQCLADHPSLARTCIVEVTAAGPRALERRDVALQGFMRFFIPGRKEAPAGVPVPELASEAIIGSLYEIVYARVLHQRTHELPDLLPELMYCALAPYVGPRRAARDLEASRPPARSSQAPAPPRAQRLRPEPTL